MVSSAFYKSLEEKLGPVAGIGASAAIVLHALGYLSVRFWLRSLGLRPDLELLSELFLFEGAAMLLFLLTTITPLLGVGLLVAGLVVAARKIPRLRSWTDGLAGRFAGLPAGAVAVLGSLWGVLTVQLFLRHVLRYRTLVQDGVPCDPPWLRAVAFSDGPLESYFFALLVLLPLPTLWAVNRLPDDGPWRPLAVLLGLVALVQILFVPIHYGILVGHAHLPRIQIEGAESEGRTWEIYSSKTHVHLLTVDEGTPPLRRIRVVPQEELGTVSVIAVDDLFEVLTEGRTCGP